ncbi:polysaccharide biosynthesis C-terminal domain-containing protein [[Brevibacterium] frigoritolerans]|uniref:Polysaccharide biosynthesis C-terminal domain-containing protein n=1 Tax=Peribacillus frigoritolerans TaxID=450367 RepID=A0A941JAR3_9BACI|nr:polysaccharide biosynthesis C-terminal domain-containing protein [Peribacillus frigoritolerans]
MRSNWRFRVSATIGVAAAIGLVVTMKPVNHMLFTDVKGTITLAIFSLSILFTSLIMAEAAVIQSLGHSFVPVIITIVGVGSKWALNLVLVPHYKIAGAASATVLAYMIMTVLFYVVLKVHIKKTLIEKQHVLIILKSTGVHGYGGCFIQLFIRMDDLRREPVVSYGPSFNRCRDRCSRVCDDRHSCRLIW